MTKILVAVSNFGY